MSLPVSDRAPELFPGFEPEDFAAFLRHAWTDPSKTPARKAAMRRLDSLVHAPFSALKAAHPELDLVWVRSATEPCTENDGRVQSGLLALVRGSTQRRWAEHEAERRRELRRRWQRLPPAARQRFLERHRVPPHGPPGRPRSRR